jgi:L-glutamine-phosphate cytidylyltransferase
VLFPAERSPQPSRSSMPEKITTAVVLAAGQGFRLRPLTERAPKCLTEIAGEPILGRLIDALEETGFRRLIIVTGHLHQQISDFVALRSDRLEVICIFNPDYLETNNIVSLWCAAPRIDGPFTLIESDLVFEPAALLPMQVPDRIAVDVFHEDMPGSTVMVRGGAKVAAMQVGNAPKPSGMLYKTVNIYSFSVATWHEFRGSLKQTIEAGATDQYYERALSTRIEDGSIVLEAVHFGGYDWDEIDSIEDLFRAERRFAGRKVVRPHAGTHAISWRVAV